MRTEHTSIFEIWSCIRITCEVSPVFSTDLSKAISLLQLHYENMPIQIYRKFHFQKLKIFK